ncbi:hypothetical protein ACS0TY_018914 [Phlomoides rotata]
MLTTELMKEKDEILNMWRFTIITSLGTKINTLLIHSFPKKKWDKSLPQPFHISKVMLRGNTRIYGPADSDDEARQVAVPIITTKKRPAAEPKLKKKLSKVVLEDEEAEGNSSRFDTEESVEDHIPLAKKLKLGAAVSKSFLQRIGLPQGTSSTVPSSTPLKIICYYCPNSFFIQIKVFEETSCS